MVYQRFQQVAVLVFNSEGIMCAKTVPDYCLFSELFFGKTCTSVTFRPLFCLKGRERIGY